MIISGSVGIGLTNPQYNLDVSNTAEFYQPVFVGTPTAPGHAATKSYVDSAIATATVTIATNQLWSGSTTGSIWNANGANNVGIGTTNPLFALNIQGTGGTTGFVAFNNASSSLPYVGLGYDQAADGLAFKYNSGGATLNNTGMFMDRSGNIGIGTNALGGAKFLISAASAGSSDSFSDQSHIASLVGASVGASGLQVAAAVCGSYSVQGPDGLTYGTVVGEDGNCWLDRNLGATRVATSYNDSSAYGYLYQWGRGIDGHQITTSGVTTTLSSTDQPGNANFIEAPNSPYDWRSPQNNNLWQGVNGVNNPCPSGFRLPTSAEWSNEIAHISGFTTGSCGGSSSCLTTAFNSNLKLPSAGLRNSNNAALGGQGSVGYYWSSGVSGAYGVYMYFYSAAVGPVNSNYRAYGFSVRCLKN